MLTLEKIDIALIQSDNNIIPQNVIAIAVLINPFGEAQHSAILIGVNSEYYLFHYPGMSEYALENPVPSGEWYFHKNLEIIDSEESLSFLHHCQIIMKDAEPKYGFVYDGSYYENGQYISSNNLKELTTCVGFCINVISGFLFKHQYFEFEDWNDDANENQYFKLWKEHFSKKFPDKDIAQYKPHFRRITPAELTASAFIQEIPIRKSSIDKIIKLVEEVLRKKRFPAIAEAEII